MARVLVESPYMFRHPDAGERALGLLRNITYARLALRCCFLDGHAPFASHLLYTQPLVLNDDIAAERDLGINAGLAWGEMAERTLLYVDLGLSTGMRYGIELAEQAGRPITEGCRVPGWATALQESPWDTLRRLDLYDEDALIRVREGDLSVFGPKPLDAGFTAARSPRR